MSGWYKQGQGVVIVSNDLASRHRLGCAVSWPSEPVLRDEDVDVDDISVGHHAPDHVVHL